MISLSRGFQRALFNDDRNYDITADITLLSGTTINVANTQIWAGGVSFDDAVSDDDTFAALGSTIINSATLTLDNRTESLSSYDFTDAKVVIYVSKKIGNSTEKIKKGTYYVDDPMYQGHLITLTLLDFMSEFDEPYSTSNLTYPATLSEIVRDACSRCDVSLQTTSFPHSDYSVNARPEADSLTYREVIGWAATIAGCFARCNRDGKLELKWFDQETLETTEKEYDGGTFNPWSTGDTLEGGSFSPWNDGTDYDQGGLTDDRSIHFINQLYSENVSVDDVIITQVKAIVRSETEDSGSEDVEYVCGEKGYSILIEGNEFITPEKAEEVVGWLGDQLIGLTFRKASITHTNTPAIEAGDIALVWDSKGREYPILVTRTSFVPYGQQRTISAAETPSRNSATKYSTRTKAYVDARKLMKREMTDRERELEKLAEKLAVQSGLYSTVEVQEDGSSIYYLHDRPELADSQTIWKMTSEAWGVSTDGGEHWNAGMTVDGDTIVRILTATGVNAEWINTGALTITKDKGTSTATEILYANADNGVVRLTAKDTSGNETFYLNSSTGEIRISGSTKVGNTTLDSYVDGKIPEQKELTKQDIFNKLTDNGAVQGIYLQDNKLYLNGSYMAMGTIASTNGNTSWNLETGAFAMNSGSINLGGKFVVDANGNLTCRDAQLYGTVKSTISDGWFVELAGAEIRGGNGENIYARVGFDTSVTDPDTNRTYHGMKIYKGAFRVWTPILTISGGADASSDCYKGYTGTIKVTYNMASDMSSCSSGTIRFINGICVECP